MLKLSKIIKIRGPSSGTDNSILAQVHQIIKFLVLNYQGCRHIYNYKSAFCNC